MRVFIVAVSLLALSACSGGEKNEEVLIDNTEAANVAMPETDLAAPPAAAENVTNTATPAAPPSLSEEQQIRDDADASGLTARLPDESTQPATQGGNELR